MSLIRILTLQVSCIGILSAVSLFSVYNEAGPAEGYDKYLVLDPDIVYTGGLGVFEDDVYIAGNGAAIDLQEGNGIWVYGDEDVTGSLDITHCSVVNGGAYALNFAGIANGSVINCNLVSNLDGLQVMDSATVVLKNTNLVNNEHYGIAVYSLEPTVEISYCNAWDNGENYMENCPG